MNKATTGGILLVLSSIGTAFFNYLLSIVLSWMLDPAAFGTIGVSQSLIFLGGWFLIAGFPWVTAQTLAQVTPSEYPTIYPILKGALWGNILLGLLLSGGLWLAFSIGLLPLNADYAPLIACVAIIIFLLAVRLAFDGVLQGKLQFAQLSLVRSVEVIIQFASAIFLLFLGYGAPGALAGFACGTAISLLLCIWLTRDVPFWQTQGFDMRTISALRPAIPFLLANLSAVLLVNVDLLALKFLSSPAQADTLVAHYQVATVLARIPYYVSQSFLTIIFPLIARHAYNSEEANRAGRQALQIVISLVLSLNILLMAAPQATIAFFFPPIYLTAAPVLRLLALSMTEIILAQTLATILQAREKPIPAALSLALAALLQILVALWLVPQFGLIGAALSSCLAGAVGLAMMLLVARQLFPSMLQISTRYLAGQSGAFVLLLLMAASLPLLDRLSSVLWIAAAVSVYALSLLFINFMGGNFLIKKI